MVANLQKHCNLTVFKMAAVRHLGFLKFRFLTARAVRRHFAPPHQISQRSVKPLWGYSDFCDFQDGGRRHLEFSKHSKF